MVIQEIPSGIETAGIGYVVIPKELDADTYIAHCYKTYTVSMHGGVGYGLFHNISVDKEKMQEIQFPKSSEKKGSALIWINIPNHNKPIIIGVLKYRDEKITHETNAKRITRESNGNAIDVFLRANDATIDLNIIGNDETDANLNLNIKNKSKNCKLQIDVSGDIITKSSSKTILISEDLIQLTTIDSEGKIKGILKYKLGEGLTYKDEFSNEIYANADNVKVKAKEVVNIGDGKEPMILGNTLADFLDSFIDEVAKSTVTTVFGSSPLLNSAQITLLKENTKTILSKYSNTD